MTSIPTLVAIGLFTIFISLIAYGKGYFRMPKKEKESPPITFRHLLFLLIAFLSVTFLFGRILYFLILPLFKKFGIDLELYRIPFNTTINFSMQILFLLLIYLFFRIFDRKILTYVWKRKIDTSTTISKDLLFGALSWLLLYPYMIIASSLLEKLCEILFSIKEFPDQLAIAYLKSTMQYPLFFTLTLISIVIFAPIFEELVFRGILLNFLKKYLGRWGGIVLSGLLFSLFHFAKDQGYANIPILGALFLVGIFLGFVYEKKASLFASIALHATINGVVSLQIIFS